MIGAPPWTSIFFALAKSLSFGGQKPKNTH